MARKSKDGTTTDDMKTDAPLGRATKLSVVATAPLWRGPPGWDMYWPAGETIVDVVELASREPELVEAMIACLEEDPHFSVQVEREKVEG